MKKDYRLPDETDPAIEIPKYRFRITADDKTVVITNDRNEVRPYRVDVLRFMAASSGLPDPVRDMAREALAFAGKPFEEREEKEIFSDTITSIEGVKVYRDLMSTKFLARIGDKILRRRNLSNLRRDIRRSL